MVRRQNSFHLQSARAAKFTICSGWWESCLSAAITRRGTYFHVRQHQISVFIFQEQELGETGENKNVRTALSFEVRTWRYNGLRYFVIGDAGDHDLDQLSELIKAAS